ncbi:PRD domain-containing protein [Enterococcus ratti]|nr:PRD domain-containing protein [Enterococcus ratti]
MKLSEEAKKIIQESRYKVTLMALIEYTEKALEKAGVQPVELQWTILINHLNEMIGREKEKRFIGKVDPEMFSEVSKESLDIADRITKKIGQLPKDEMYVLSIHFESAKQNQ